MSRAEKLSLPTRILALGQLDPELSRLALAAMQTRDKVDMDAQDLAFLKQLYNTDEDVKAVDQAKSFYQGFIGEARELGIDEKTVRNIAQGDAPSIFSAAISANYSTVDKLPELTNLRLLYETAGMDDNARAVQEQIDKLNNESAL